MTTTSHATVTAPGSTSVHEGVIVPDAPRTRWQRLVRGRPGDPAWARPSLLLLLLGTAVLYLWDLGASGYANDFYASAVQAGTQSWKAMLFGSLDAGNSITVDKPAAFLWPMEISGRIFGFGSWSMLVPQALEGVAAVGLLYATVRRVSGHAAALVAGAALALTPVAVLMFRYNNPDSMLVLLLVAAGYCMVRALENASTRWILGAGALVGLGFITKMGQALLVVPFFAIAYLVAAPTGFVRRLWQTLAAGLAVVVGSGWWIAIVELWPASSRPYIGGSTDNSILNLAFGYNGLGRLFGGAGNGGGGNQGGNFGGSTGLTRMFGSIFGTQISWLLPTALLALVAGLWLTRRNARTDLTRAALIVFGGWMLVTGLVFSEMQGTIHPYYSVALAPAIAAVIALTGRELWRTRASVVSRALFALLIAVTAWWDTHLLGLMPTFMPWLKYGLAIAAAATVFLLLMANRFKGLVVGLLLVAGLAGLGGSAALALDTASTPKTGSTPTAGPAGASQGGFGGGGTRPGGAPTGVSTTGTAGTAGTAPAGAPGGGDSATASSELVALLQATDTRWAAATTSSMTAAPYQLASGKSVMPIGGFNGGDASPTLAQFQAWVAEGKISYFIAGNGGGGGRGGSAGGTGSAITTWVAAHYTAKTVGGTTIYDLTVAAK
jgi:4-amino-4-deoxy-L-arabinose transferase-like glycosyltransferase